MNSKTNRSSTKKSAPQPGSNDNAGPDKGFLTMPEAIEFLKTTRPTFYRWVRAGRIKATKAGRQWRFQQEDLVRFIQGDAPNIDLPVSIAPLLRILHEKIDKAGVGAAFRDIPKTASPLEEAVVLMIIAGMSVRASDIHITAHPIEGKNCAVVRYRVDGVLHLAATFDVRLLPAVVQEWKRMASCDIREKEKIQDGRIQIDARGTILDLRVNFLPSQLGESVTVRILDASSVDLDIDHLGYAPHDLEKLQRILKSPWGLIFVTGPTGVGKTTTLYSCLNRLASPNIKIMSIEDPVECVLPWATQVAVNASVGLTFASAARAALRSDPDVLLIAEIRDLETLTISQQAALTGHLVLSVLHTDEAASALKRMIDIGSNPFLVGDSTKLMVGQRLIRKLCPHCSVEETPKSDILDRAMELAREGGLEWRTLAPKFRKSQGCSKCNDTGYLGRTVMAEMLEITPEISKALRENASVKVLREIGVKQGMTTQAADGIRRAANGETSLSEVLRMLGITAK